MQAASPSAWTRRISCRRKVAAHAAHVLKVRGIVTIHRKRGMSAADRLCRRADHPAEAALDVRYTDATGERPQRDADAEKRRQREHALARLKAFSDERTVPLRKCAVNHAQASAGPVRTVRAREAAAAGGEMREELFSAVDGVGEGDLFCHEIE